MLKAKYYKSQKVIETYDHLPPPRSVKYGKSAVAKESHVKIGHSHRYLMRNLECGAVELVRSRYAKQYI